MKKWDKRSKSSTKELYLSRQIEIQPCFNRDILTELTDAGTTYLAEVDLLLERDQEQQTDVQTSSSSSSSEYKSSALNFTSTGGTVGGHMFMIKDSTTGRTIWVNGMDVLYDLENNLMRMIASGDVVGVNRVLDMTTAVSPPSNSHPASTAATTTSTSTASLSTSSSAATISSLTTTATSGGGGPTLTTPLAGTFLF